MTHEPARRGSRLLRLAVTVIAVSAVLAAVFAASTTAAGQAVASRSAGSTLNLAFLGAPFNLDPAKNGIGSQLYSALAYEPLIYQQPDGSLAPGLAVKWGYRGKGNKIFQLTLRSGVKFSDGSPLTAAVVKDWLLRFKAAKGPNASQATDIAAVNTSGTRVVAIILANPNPLLPLLLSQNYLMGDVVSGSANAAPERLATSTAGAGPYTLDPSQTVANDHYTYVQNPNYWNKQVKRFQKVVVTVMTNPNAVLQAMRTGQVDEAQGDLTTVKAAQSAGLKVLHKPANVVGLVFLDRDGKMAAPLAKQGVRQAINYAIDRKAIAKALFGAYGSPSAQLTLPGLEGYDPAVEKMYPYNPTKAKQLLTAAGFANGLTLPVLSTPLSNIDLITQAVASYLEKVGIHLDIHSDATFGQYAGDLIGAKYPVFAFSFGAETYYRQGLSMFLPNALANPFHNTDAEISSLFSTAAGQSKAGRVKTYQELARRISSLAWFAPVAFQDRFYYARSTVAGVQMTTGNLTPDPHEWRPAG